MKAYFPHSRKIHWRLPLLLLLTICGTIPGTHVGAQNHCGQWEHSHYFDVDQYIHTLDVHYEGKEDEYPTNEACEWLFTSKYNISISLTLSLVSQYFLKDFLEAYR